MPWLNLAVIPVEIVHMGTYTAISAALAPIKTMAKVLFLKNVQ